MKITIFTANQRRHNYFINLLSEVCDELFVVQESRSLFPGKFKNFYKNSLIMEKYFKKVSNAEKKLFGNQYINRNSQKIKILPISYGDLNYCTNNVLNDFLKSKYYIVFGSSYIKGPLINFLVKKKAINIHMGISPFYRGTDCNFWALYDGNPHLVGATIHFLSKGLDNGQIIYHAISNHKNNEFEYTMSAAKSAFHSIVEKIKNNSLYKMKKVTQDSKFEIRYSKKIDFNDYIIKKFYKKNLKINREFDLSKLTNPFILYNKK